MGWRWTPESVLPPPLDRRASPRLYWPVKDVKDFQLLRPSAEAVGILDQSRSDRSVGADRTACAGWEHQDPDPARVRHQTLRLANANRDPSSPSATKQPLRQRLVQPARQSATALIAGSPQGRYGAQFINTVAGRLRLSGECPAHHQGLVSLGLFAQRPPRPTVGVMSSDPSLPWRAATNGALQ